MVETKLIEKIKQQQDFSNALNRWTDSIKLDVKFVGASDIEHHFSRALDIAEQRGREKQKRQTIWN